MMRRIRKKGTKLVSKKVYKEMRGNGKVGIRKC